MSVSPLSSTLPVPAPHGQQCHQPLPLCLLSQIYLQFSHVHTHQTTPRCLPKWHRVSSCWAVARCQPSALVREHFAPSAWVAHQVGISCHGFMQGHHHLARQCCRKIYRPWHAFQTVCDERLGNTQRHHANKFQCGLCQRASDHRLRLQHLWQFCLWRGTTRHWDHHSSNDLELGHLGRIPDCLLKP